MNCELGNLLSLAMWSRGYLEQLAQYFAVDTVNDLQKLSLRQQGPKVCCVCVWKSPS